MGLCGLVVLLACTVGETPPGTPSSEGRAGPAAESPDRPGMAPGADAAVAAELLEQTRSAYEVGEVEEALRLATEVLTEHRGTPSEADARWLAARSAFALGRYDEARDLAELYAGRASGDAASEARRLAELAGDAQEEPSPVTVGAVLPRTGPRVLVRYADWVLEGIELAIAEAERDQGRRIELIVADDAGGFSVQEAVRDLERRGAIAIIGPMLPEHVGAAAGARTSRDLVLVSPTSTAIPRSPGAYVLNSTDVLGARELARYAADVGFTQAAVLYPRIREYEGKADAFAEEFRALGGRVRGVVPYDSGTTTFDRQIRDIAAAVAPDPLDVTGSGAQPFALFVPALERDVAQIAPQLTYYGLANTGVQVFGDEAWATEGVRRTVPTRDLDGVIVASRFPPERADAAADPAFIQAYESRYRRSLENNLPALGYDAANLIMQALPNRVLTPDAFARRFHLLAGIRGATGLLSVRTDRVVRTPYLVVVRNGGLEPVAYPWEYRMPVPAAAGGTGGAR